MNVEETIFNYGNSGIPIIININIQSLHSKFDALNQFILDLTAGGVFVIAITLQEIWKIGDINMVQIPNFSLFFTERKKNRGGGVGIYIHSSYSANINRPLSHFHEKFFEAISVDIKYQKKKYTISCIYRPPTNTAKTNDDFFTIFEDFLTISQNFKHAHFILTDSNFNLLKIHLCSNTQKYLNLLHNNGYLQLIFKATRIQNNNFSLIDHICCKNETYDITTGVVIADISDHFPSFISFKNIRQHQKHKTIQTRNFSENNISLFKQALSTISWENVTTQTEVNASFNEFWDTFNSLFDLYFPQTTQKLNRNVHKLNDFLTTGLLTSRKTKNILHKKSISDPSPTNISKFKTYRNLYNTLLKKSKLLYFHAKLQKN